MSGKGYNYVLSHNAPPMWPFDKQHNMWSESADFNLIFLSAKSEISLFTRKVCFLTLNQSLGEVNTNRDH